MAKNCRSANPLSTNGNKNQGSYKPKPNNDFYKGNYSGTVGLILEPNVFENHVSVVPVEVIESKAHPLYWPHMAYGSLVNYDDESSERSISILQDTGALMSIINANLISDRNAIQTGEFRLIQGATGVIQKLPLVEISIKSKIATGKFLCCSSTQLPAGVDLICGNDICRDVENDDLTTCVVTRSMSAAADHSVTADRIQISNIDHVEDVNDLDDLDRVI